MTQHTKSSSVLNKWMWVAILFVVVITIASLAPTSQLPKTTINYADKAVHLVIHTLLFLSWAKAFQPFITSANGKYTLIIILLSCMVYGIIIEVLQELLTSYRTADVMDVVANLAGTIIGFLIFSRRRK